MPPLKPIVWKFVARTIDRSIGYRFTEQALPDGSMRFEGTGVDALEAARSIVPPADNPFQWIAAVHEGPCDLEDDPAWTAFEVHERQDKKGWNLESHQTGAPICYQERAEAVAYAAFQARGHVAVVRVFERDNTQRSLLLIDQRGDEVANFLFRR